MELILDGELHLDTMHRLLYATDASAYREVPAAVAVPRNIEDLKKLIRYATLHRTPLIPRMAGTSLAGQVVGNGIVTDLSRYFTRILEINPKERWVRVEPGVILDELNKAVAPFGLFFGPETSTSSRCMIGGMVGNNSCGAHSIIYGSTRDHVISVSCLLSDGSEAEFSALSTQDFRERCRLENLEGALYRQIRDILTDPVNRESIHREYPDPSIHRRNTGYAIDLLLASYETQDKFNFSKLICGSEGTLAMITEIKLNLVPLPPKEKALVCVHCHSVGDALKANLIALKYGPGSVELMDKPVMDCTKDNITQRRNRFFIEGDPGAILIVEFARETREEILSLASGMKDEMRANELGYHFPVVFPPEMKRVWDLRKAGLGVLSNYPGDRKPVPVTEDTAVTPQALPEYIREFDEMLKRLGLSCVYYAHVGSGELHLRPVLNLKDPGDVELFHTVALESARLVKKYRGSLSGEHGDGRLRGEFIPLMIGDHNFNILRAIKSAWDPVGIFNPGKITDTPKMNTSLRYQPGKTERDIHTYFDFSRSQGILRASEQCNGSGDCRNTVLTGRWMCPSYMATRDEQTTTRARANILREFLTHSERSNPFDHQEIYEVMDLCLSCKACKSECPSNVDMARLKAEFLQHYYDSNGVPFRSMLIANITRINRLGSLFPQVYNYFQRSGITSGLLKRLTGFAQERDLPMLWRTTLRAWAARQSMRTDLHRSVYLFVDEFTNYTEVETGISAIRFLNAIGYRVILPDHEESGRTYLSKGLVRKARKIANHNIRKLKDLVSGETPLIGLEPSAILSFRDEYPDLAAPGLKDAADKLARHAMLFEEFVVKVAPSPDLFTRNAKKIMLHGHCHQKALASTEPTIKMLSIPMNYHVEEIPSGCCGMAGSFGFEKEHFEVSMQVGELVLFPAVRSVSADTIIAAPGTSCRQQIMDGTGRRAYHPAEIMLEALKDE